MENNFKRFLSLAVAMVMVFCMFPATVFAAEADTDFTDATADVTGEGWTWVNETKTLTLNGANITSAVTLPDGSTIVAAEGTENSVIVKSGNAISCEGALAITGSGKLTAKATQEAACYAVVASAVSITDTVVDFYAYYYGIQVKTTSGDADSVVELNNVSGKIGAFGYGGINAHSETANVSVKLTGCENLELYNEASNDSSKVEFNFASIRAYTRGNGKDALVELSGCKNVAITNSTIAVVAATNANAANAEAANANVHIVNSTGINLTANTSFYSPVFVNNYGIEADDTSNLLIENSTVEVNAPNGCALMTSTKSAPSEIDIVSSDVTITAGVTGMRTISNNYDYTDTDVINSKVTFTVKPTVNYVDECNPVLADEWYFDEDSTIIKEGESTVEYVAEVVETGVKYESLKEALEDCTNGETVKLIADITYDAADIVYAHGGATGFGTHDKINPSIVYIGGTKGATAAENQPSDVNAILDLNGHTITNNADAYLFLIMDNAKLTFKDSIGTGSVTTTTEYPVIWVVGTDTLVTIDSGKYTTASDKGLLWSTHAGDLVITGGEFHTTADDASLLIVRNERDINNANNFIKGKATVTVSGGTYYGFNPESTFDDSTNPYTEFNAVAEGYKAIHNEAKNAWIVNDYVEWIKAELLAGNDVVLEQDIVVDGSYVDSIPAATNGNGKYPNYGIFNVIGDEVTFDLNGHTITYNGHEDIEWNGKIYSSCATAHGIFYANDHADLTIIDSSEDQTGTVLIHGLASGAYVASPDTKLTVTGGTWRNDGCAEGCGTNILLYPLQGGELYITGGFFEQALDTAGDSYLMVEHGGEYKNNVIDYAKTKIVVTGGIFAGMNPEQALYFQQTADNKLVTGENKNVVADGYCAKPYTDQYNKFVKGNTWIIGEAVAYNVQKDLYYGDLSDALDVAASGETVQLLRETTEELVLVPAGVTFDLNGNVVTADNVLSFGVVMDGMEKVGGIKIDIDTATAFTKLQPENGGYLPIYDTRDKMYKFFDYNVENNMITTEGNSVTFWSRVVFTNSAGYEVLANTENSGLDFVLTMNWTGMNGFGIRFYMSDGIVQQYAQGAYDLLQRGELNVKALKATISGVDTLGAGAYISAAPSVETVAEVTDYAGELVHDIT